MESYYAKIENNIVTTVEVVTDEFFNANPQRYNGKWLKVGNGSTREFCGKDYNYLQLKDKIIPPKPYPSWALDSNDEWQASKSRPTPGIFYWDENILDWKSKK